jgi:hypothetical protein
LIPALANAAKLAASTDDGLASSVISMFGANPHRASASAAPEEDRSQRLSACHHRLGAHIRNQRRLPRRDIDPGPNVRVEIAIGAFLGTKWPMNIKRAGHDRDFQP